MFHVKQIFEHLIQAGIVRKLSKKSLEKYSKQAGFGENLSAFLQSFSAHIAKEFENGKWRPLDLAHSLYNIVWANSWEPKALVELCEIFEIFEDHEESVAREKVTLLLSEFLAEFE